MVITKQKDLKSIKNILKDFSNVLILGCSECATLCRTGGNEEVAEKLQLLDNAIDAGVLTTACNVLQTKKELKDYNLENVDAILSYACGNGVQVISDLTNLPVIPGNDTLFVGERLRNGIFEENCRTCGECVLGRTAAICPVSRCSKGLLNGPCGGATNGKCEVDEELDCAWVLIFNRLKEMDRLDLFSEIQPLRSYIDSSHQRTLNMRKNK